jgi:TolB-like protein/Flp pilus assembly protein TadD
MGIDEAGTLGRLKALRREIMDPAIAAHAGRMVKLMGDGALVEFASAVDAVTCAIEIQKRIREHDASGAEGNRIEFRIGINVGDIIVEGDDIYGDGVNVAARIQALADPGGIYISRGAAEQVRDKVPIKIETRGEQTVKNIARPIEVFCIMADERDTITVTLPVPGTAAQSPVVTDKPSIAVLAFNNMSGDHDQEYFSDGISEDIITNLSRNRVFFVISRSTSFTYKGAAVDVAKVARELGVRYVLEGSVRRAGNRVRITAQLIDAASGHHLWADRYDRELADVFVVQDEIARNITGAIAPGIISAEMQHAQRKDPSQLDAWDHIMRAHWRIRRFTQDDMAEARRLLTQAIALDPANSMALSDLAFACHFEAVFGWGDGPAASHAVLGEAARKAVAMDDSDAAAHTALAIYDLFSGRHEESRRRLRRALDLDPDSVFARGYLGASYAFSGDYEAALPHLDEAIRLSPRDPLLIIWHVCKGWAALLTQRYEEAVGFATLAAEANPEFPDIYAVLAAANGQLARVDAAHAALDQLSRRMPALTTNDERLSRPLERPEHRESFLEGLRKAGMPA